ncbi:hypothetical protein [Kribbella sp. NPDC051770]|uniref:hypothetical protein n=1 Tax=Kribbella sp. NPDC051770 TaxID=3155413 RepID=UPI003446063F
MTPHEPVGSVAEEAAKLFAVLRAAGAADFGGAAARAEAGADAADEAARAEAAAAGEKQESAEADNTAGAGGSAAEADHAHGIGRGAECVWCPVCQVINKVRSTSPETIEQLSTAAAGVLGAVRGLMEAAAEAARQAKVDAESRAAGEQDEERPARSRVDRIDVSEDPEPWD